MRTRLWITAIVCLAGLCQAGLSQAGSSQTAADQERTRLEKNKAIVRGYMDEVVNKGDQAAVDTYFAADAVFNSRPAKAQLALTQAVRQAFPDFRLTIEDQVAEGDKVVTRVTFSGTHSGDLGGIAPTGKRVKYSGIAIDRIAEGRVVESWHVAETLSLFQQIGAKLSAEPKK
jgi:predicted ester cyclase